MGAKVFSIRYMLSNIDKKSKFIGKVQLFFKRVPFRIITISEIWNTISACCFEAMITYFLLYFLKIFQFYIYSHILLVNTWKLSFQRSKTSSYFFGTICGFRIITRYYPHLDRNVKFPGLLITNMNILRYIKVRSKVFWIRYILSNIDKNQNLLEKSSYF